MKGCLRLCFRLLGLATLAAGLVFVAFVVYKGARPMHIQEAYGMTYWQFMRDRIGAIRQLPSTCQQLHFTGYALAVPLDPIRYTVVGVFPNSFLEGHLQPDSSIPKGIRWFDAADVWWLLVETISWEAWETPHVPGILPECNLRAIGS